MSSAAESQPGPSNPHHPPLEVEEAELSSDAESRPTTSRSHKRTDHADGDFVLDDNDLEDDDDSYQSLSHNDSNPEQSTNHKSLADADQPSPSPNPQSTLNNTDEAPAASNSRPSPDKNSTDSLSASPGSSSANDSSESDDVADAASASSGDEPDEDDLGSGSDPQHKPKSADKMEIDDEDSSGDDQEMANGIADDSHSDDHSNLLVRKRTRSRRREKIVIPEDMLNDSEYFRRSRRSRHAPERLSISPVDSPSSIGGSEYDFNADDGTFTSISACSGSHRGKTYSCIPRMLQGSSRTNNV